MRAFNFAIVVGSFAIGSANFAYSKNTMTLQEVLAEGAQLRTADITPDPYQTGDMYENLYFQKGSTLYLCEGNLKDLFKKGASPILADTYVCGDITKDWAK